MSSIFVGDNPFTQQGDIKVPQELRVLFDKDGFGTGTSLTFDYDGERVIIMDSALYALKGNILVICYVSFKLIV